VCKEVGGADAAVNYREKDWQQQVKGVYARIEEVGSSTVDGEILIPCLHLSLL
jgi:NADPH:quinone reductase-like Zn-dependent oxidoreductase